MTPVIYELPLFPLNTVLFPYTPIQLQIFEERYLRMIGACVANKQPFGVVLIKRGSEAFGPVAEPYMVGCAAEITQVERLSGGRLNIVAVGRERFRILSLDSRSQPYLLGMVEWAPLETGDPVLLAEAGRKLRPQVERFLSVLSMSGMASVQALSLPEEPLMLAYLSAALLQSPSKEKQALLEARNASEMVRELLSIVRRETALLQAIIAKKDNPDQGTFSVN